MADALQEAFVYGIFPYLIPLTCLWILVLVNFLSASRAVAIGAFISLGFFLGVYTGGSKSPVVAAVLPAAVTVIGTLLGYFFDKTSLQRIAGVSDIPALILVLVISATAGAYYGAELRDLDDRSAREAREGSVSVGHTQLIKRLAHCMTTVKSETLCQKAILD
ncbi:MAG: hypothetical protein AAGG69_03370 [Pseudomonadota bacterium]